MYIPTAADPDGDSITITINSNLPTWMSQSTLVTTLSGQGPTGSFADGTLEEARFDGPNNLVITRNGTMFVADQYNNRIRKIDVNGIVSTFAGSTSGFADGDGSSAKFYYPKGLALDSEENLLVADAGNDRIRKITPEGIVTTIAGTDSAGYLDGEALKAKFDYPDGILVANDGSIYVAENHHIRQITTSGNVVTIAGSTGGYLDGNGTSAQFFGCSGMALDKDGFLFVADAFNNRIRKINSQGEVTTVAGSGATGWLTGGFADGTLNTAEFNSPQYIAFNRDGTLLATDEDNHRIRNIDILGDSVYTIAGNGAESFVDSTSLNASFDIPRGIAVGKDGTIYICDWDNECIRKLGNGIIGTPDNNAIGSYQINISAIANGDTTYQNFTISVVDKNTAISNTAIEKAYTFSIIKNTITFSHPLPLGSSVSIYNLSGQMISTTAIEGQHTVLPSLSRGVYITEVRAGARSVVRKISVK